MRVWRYDELRRTRRPTRTVKVGDVAVGSDHPIRIQSMTTPATTDTAATVAQIRRLVEAGCEIVRVTVPTSRDADNLPDIRGAMAREGLHVPLVADIHFTPAAAMRAVEHVEKIRINPGNFADKKKFAVREYDDREYEAELARIADVFTPLVLRARELGVAMRIGTNHGSLSDRIMNRYGDTAEGMVESALEFVRICEGHGYHDLILSMKASNPLVVHHAYRLLVERMADEEMDYPLHLGVTEAGDGEDGRVKSAMGIGVLLAEGIGDTIRVSLTEDPVAEIPVARALAAACSVPPARDDATRPAAGGGDPFSYRRRDSDAVACGPCSIGGGATVAVEVPLSHGLDAPEDLRAELDRHAGVRVAQETRADVVRVALRDASEIGELERLHAAMQLVAGRVALAVAVPPDLPPDERVARACHRIDCEGDPSAWREVARAASTARCGIFPSVEAAVEAARDDARILVGLCARTAPLQDYRRLAAALAAAGCRNPVLLLDDPAARGVDPLLGPSTDLGGALCGGIGDAIRILTPDSADSRRVAFGVLQAARVRITRTEFISCPSCGRTLFDLEETTARIKQRTSHLKGVKIAVMGCIVNGPGEMADADFGYVGWGDDKIALFVGKDMVAKDIPTADADRRLVELIREHGRWVDPPAEATEEAPATRGS